MSRGFTLTEFVVVAAIVGLLAALGVRYYFTNVDMYRFENALTEFKSSVNLARMRSMSGRVVSSSGVTGITPGAVQVTHIACSGDSMTVTTSTPHNFPTGSYVTMQGIRPADPKSFTDPKLYTINGRLYQVTATGGDGSTSLTLQFLDQHPVNCLAPDTSWNMSLSTTQTDSTACVFLKYAVRITPVRSIGGGGYSRITESGPCTTFQYNKEAIKVESPPGTELVDSFTILFDKGLTLASQTYMVRFTCQKSGSWVSYTILPAGAIR